MTDWLIILIVLGILLSMVTLLGHGIWLVLAWLFSPAQRKPSRRDALVQLQSELTRLASIGTIDEATRDNLSQAIQLQLEERLPSVQAEAPADIQFDDEIIEADIVVADVIADEPPVEEVVAKPRAEIHERAERYAAARQAASVAVEQPTPAPTSTPVPVHRQALSRVLSAFMEERNIRWGELVGGMLIVCCSIALVISFWSQIAERPLLKFVIFNGVSAGLFAAGFYTLRRWQIHTTSQGLLIIATLLVPLNFLAIAAFTKDSPPTDALSIGGELISLTLFSALCYFAARSLTPSAPILLTVGVMVASAAQLITRRFAGDDPHWATQYAMAALPLGCYLTVMGIYLWQAVRVNTKRSAGRLFIMFGITTYAAIIPLGLLVQQSGAIIETLSRLAPLVTLLALPALATGLLFWRRLASSVAAIEQTIGIGIGVAGTLAMVAALVLAWPEPALLLPTAITTAILFALLAWKFQLPEAQLVSAACVLLVWLVGFHVLRGDIAWTLKSQVPLLRSLLSSASGNALLPLAGAFAAGGFALNYVRRTDHARSYLIATAATTSISLLLILGFGFARTGDPSGVTWSLGIYAITSIIAALTTRRAVVGGVATSLLLAAIIQGVVFRYGEVWDLSQPWVVALLLHATLTAACVCFYDGLGRPSYISWSSLITSLVAVGLLASEIASISGYTMAAYLAWTAVVWLMLAIAMRSPALFGAFQLACGFAIASAVVGAVEHRPWYIAARRPWLDPWFLQAVGIALALYCCVWTGLRFALAKFARGRELLRTDGIAVDRILEVVVVLLLAFVSLYSIVPPVAQELALTPKGERIVPAITQFVMPHVPREHAAGWGSWVLLISVAVMLTFGLWRDLLKSRVVALLIVAALACGLLAAGWENDVAAASALRWALGGFALLASVPIWGRSSLKSVAGKIGVPLDDARSLSRIARTTILWVVVSTYGAMGGYVAVSAIARAGIPSGMFNLLTLLSVVCVATSLGALVVVFVGRATRTDDESRATWSRRATLLWQTLLMMGASPLVAVCIYVVADGLRQYPIVGPSPGSWFKTIGTSATYGVPLAAIIVALLGHALRQRSALYAFSSALLVNLLTTIVVLIELARAGRPLDTSAWIELAQINAIASAVFALAWLAIVARWGRRASDETTPTLLRSYIAFGVALCGVSLVWGVAYLTIVPDRPGGIAASGGLFGWAALALTVAAVVWLSLRTGVHYTFVAVAGALGVLVAMIALTTVHWDRGNWLAYHTLLAGFAVAACATPILARRFAKGGAASATIASLFAVMTVVLSLRALSGDPQAPWWTVGGLLAMSSLAAVLAWSNAKQRFVWASAALLNLAASIWWIESGYKIVALGGSDQFRNFLYVNAIAAAITAIYSVVVQRVRIAPQSESRGVAWHSLAIWGIAFVLLLVTFGGLVSDFNGHPAAGNGLLAIVALLGAVAVAAARLWVPGARFTVAGLYSVGAIGPAMLLDSLDIVDAPLFLWAATMFAAAYALATSYLWSRRGELIATAASLGVPLAIDVHAEKSETPTYPGHLWLVTANGLIAVLVVVAAFWIECTYDVFTQRNTSAYAVAALAFAVALLSRGRLRSPLQYFALVLGVLFAMAWGLSWVSPDIAGPWLNRLVVVVVALAAMSVLYGIGLVKFWKQTNEWTRAGQRLVPAMVTVGAVLLLLVVGIEVNYFMTRDGVPIAYPALVAVTVALVGLAIAALIAAVVPGRDPLGLSERGRTAYVYAAEIIGALIFVHIRVTMPWLFSGWFQQFWPLIAMGIAFLGVGFSEFCQRRRQTVLSQPLERTAALLPILPVMGFWIVSSAVNYSLILLTVGALYAALAVLRRSFLFSILAVLAVNGSLWRLLYTVDELGLAEHPQLWLIPPALCVLAASYLNRGRLSEQQTTAIRYLSAIVIYASSTADIFLNGVAAAPWLPGVLALFSILGIFAGIIFRIRAFLFLGTTFLMVALMTIIWYAAVELNHTWIWWVSGIVVGVLIIALFGIFEKRRDDVLRMVENLRQWEA